MILTVISGILKFTFSLSILCFILLVPAVVVTGIIGLATKEYKYFKIALKVGMYGIAVFIGSILLTSAMTFLGTVLSG